jgi:hypothetical protein
MSAELAPARDNVWIQQFNIDSFGHVIENGQNEMGGSDVENDRNQ